MAEIEIRTLRVSAEMDASKYKSGADAKVAADKAMIASGREVAQSVVANDSKISQSVDVLGRLSKQFIDGYGAQQRFANGLNQLQRGLDTGKVSLEQAVSILVGMNQKLGLTADSSMFVARGQTQLAEAIGMANRTIETQSGTLSRAVGEWQIYIAQLKEAQAEQNSAQFASANQNRFNALLGVQTQPSSSARESASAFATVFADFEETAKLKAQQIGQNFGNDLNASLLSGTSKAARDSAAVFSEELDRLDTIAQQKAQQIGANFQSDLNASFGIGRGGGSARASASVFEEAGREADQMAAKVALLRAEINPLAAAQDRLNAELAEYASLAAKGAISAEELAAAQGLARSRFSAQQNQGGLNRFGAMNATSQLQDIAITSAMGQSPMTIALQQGTQLGMAMQMSGVQGGAGLVKGLTTAFTGLLTETNLVAIGITAVAAVAIQFGSKLFDSFKTAEEKARDFNKLLSDQKEIIQSLGPAYEEMARHRDSASTPPSPGQFESIGVARLELQQNLEDARKAQQEQARAALSQMRGSGGTFLGLVGALPEGVQSALGRSQQSIEFDRIVNSASKGEMSINDARTALQRFGETHPDFAYTIGHFLQMSEAAAKAEREVGGLSGMLDQMAKIRLPEHGFLPISFAVSGDTLAAQNRMQKQFEAENLATNARSPQELAAAARARAALNPQGMPEEQATREDLAAKRALIDAEHSLKEAQDQRIRSLNESVASARLDVELVGKTTTETERLRTESQLLAQVREDAARHGIKNDADIEHYYGAEIALIKKTAAELANLKAQREAASLIKNQTDALEIQRAEVGSVGMNKLAHDALIETLKTEQKIRELGKGITAEQADELRANTAAANANAEALAKLNIQQDLLFDIRQMGRSAGDQSVASQLRSAGLPEDLDSDIAKVIRMKDEIAKMKDTWEEVFQTARDGIDGVVDALFDGGDIGEALKKVGRDFARQMFDLAVTNPLKNWLTGSNLNSIADMGIFGNGATSGRGGGFGGVLGNLLGAQKAVASMQVQAASVFINGSPLGVPGLGSIGNLINPGSSSFTPNTTLTDILTGGGGAANQNYIQQRIDQAFGPLSSNLGGIFTPAGGFANMLGGSTSASMAGGGGVAGQIWNFFAGKGLQPHQIAGILGNVSAESAFNPLAVGDAGKALGLFQWNDRAPALLNSIGGRGNLGDVGSQLSFAWKELQSSESGTLQRLLGSTDVRGATAAFAGFERPRGFSLGNPEGADNFLGRLSGAQSALAKFGSAASNATGAVGQLGGASSSALSSLVSSTSQAAGGLNALGSGAGKLGSMLGQFPAAPSGGGGGFGGLFGSLFGGLFGGGGGLNSAFSGTAAYSFLSANPGGYIGLYADGTENAPPGWAWVGEKGPELKKLRAGDVIRSNPRSVEMMKQAAGGGSNDNLKDFVRMLAPHLKSNVKIVNVQDESRLGDYLAGPAGEEIIMNIARRNGLTR